MKGIRFGWVVVLTILLVVSMSACSNGDTGEGEAVPPTQTSPPTSPPTLTSPPTVTRPPTVIPQNYAAIVSPPALWTELSPTGTAPAARKEHASVYDATNDRLIIFGGRSSTQYFNDTWVLTNASGTTGTSSWIPLSTSGETAPQRHLMIAAYNSTKNMLIVFGGADSNNLIQMNLWVLTNANGLQGAVQTWSKLTISGTSPSARARMTGAYDETNDVFIFFGGGSYAAATWTFYDETWTIRNVTNNPSWHKLNPAGTLPTARIHPSAVYDAVGNRMIIFGGNTSTANPPASSGRMNDTWVLSNANGIGGTPTWNQLSTLDKPAARSSHTAVFDSTNKRMLVFAGVGADNFARNDVWVLTDAGETTSAWAEYDTGKPRPAPRAYHSAVYTGSAKNRMVIFGGDTGNSNFVNDVWVLRNANGIPSTPVRDIGLKAASMNLCPGYTLQLTAVASDASNNEVEGVLYTWTSSDASVATVSSTGLVEGVGPGTATITVTSGDASGQLITSQIIITIATVPTTEVTTPPPTETEPVTPPLVFQSPYEGTYTGIFTFEYPEFICTNEQLGLWEETGRWITDGFRLTVTFKFVETGAGADWLEITKVQCDDPCFGTGLVGVTPLENSLALLPAEPPTTPMNPSQMGMGIQIFFPNGAILQTYNLEAGALSVSFDGTTLSSTPKVRDRAWSILTPEMITRGGYNVIHIDTRYKSWSLTKSF